METEEKDSNGEQDQRASQASMEGPKAATRALDNTESNPARTSSYSNRRRSNLEGRQVNMEKLGLAQKLTDKTAARKSFLLKETSFDQLLRD